MSTSRLLRTAATFACAFVIGCAASPGASSSASTDTGSGQGVCDIPTAGLCVAYPGDTAAQRSICGASQGSTYRAPSVCLPANRVGTCACNDVGQGLGAGTFSFYAPTFTCASAKTACARSCNGAAGTFNGGC